MGSIGEGDLRDDGWVRLRHEAENYVGGVILHGDPSGDQMMLRIKLITHTDENTVLWCASAVKRERIDGPNRKWRPCVMDSEHDTFHLPRTKIRASADDAGTVTFESVDGTPMIAMEVLTRDEAERRELLGFFGGDDGR